MNRHQSDAHQQTFSARANQSREIGLRAVAAAILYQGETGSAERTLSRGPSWPTASTTDPAK